MTEEQSKKDPFDPKTGIMTLSAQEVNPMSLNARIMSPFRKDYHVSRGKSQMIRAGVGYLVLAITVVLASSLWIPYEFSEEETTMELLSWMPRFLALGLVVIGVMKFRDINQVKPYLTFTKESFVTEHEDIGWNQIEMLEVEYSTYDSSTFNLIVGTKEQVYRFDIKGVDELSEDVAVVANKYWQKYKTPKS